ncbi:glycoside hydrolase family 3 C-terminal domain-containing protein, partial [Agathobaculum butyriciproducens]|nr:glycoside hydrolase family 3 C-terminal domain-containing protein [Agathobaculum butyriciproducens]
ALLNEAVNAAKNADIAVIFAGLPDAFENEGFDRKHIDMPKCQNELIEEICKVQKNVVVVLHNGSSITMPWLDKVNAVLE